MHWTSDLGEAELRRRLSQVRKLAGFHQGGVSTFRKKRQQETEQREALLHALQRLCRSAEFCRDRLSVGKPELRPILDALRPVELPGTS